MATPAPKSTPGSQSTFNILHGFPEALVRGMRSSFLADADYHHLTQCETLDDVRLNLSETDYMDALADMNALIPTGLQKAAVEKVSWISQLFIAIHIIFLRRKILEMVVILKWGAARYYPWSCSIECIRFNTMIGTLILYKYQRLCAQRLRYHFNAMPRKQISLTTKVIGFWQSMRWLSLYRTESPLSNWKDV